MTIIGHIISCAGTVGISLGLIRWTWEWPELIYERTKREEGWPWLWPRLLGTSEDKKFCVALIRCNLIGVVVLVGAIATYMTFVP